MGVLYNFPTPNSTLIQNQNNYIKINGTVLSHETIENLDPEQLKTIESIVTAALPQPKNKWIKML